MKINIKVDDTKLFPKKAHPTDAGFDLCARAALKIFDEFNASLKVEDYSSSDHIMIPPHGRALIGTGVRVELPIGWYADVVSRSGISMKLGFEVLNSPGIIDADYRGEIGVILHNTSSNTQFITPGDRIAQLIFHKLEPVELSEALFINDTVRGEGGFGSSGVSNF